jgi:NADH dehydrogenase
VVDLVGIIQEHPPQVTFENVHVVGTRTVVAACLATSVQKLVYISALGADLQGPTRYYQTKAQAEELIKASGLSYTILRPSLMFGQGAGFTQQLVQQIKRWPVIPIVGSGLYQFQPIAVDVTADCVVKALPSLTDNRIYDLVGPEFLSLAEITQRLAENLNIVKPKIHVPVWLLKIVAGLEALGVKVPITRDQLVMLTRGSTGDGQAMRQDLHPEQIAFKSSGNYPLY